MVSNGKLHCNKHTYNLVRNYGFRNCVPVRFFFFFFSVSSVKKGVMSCLFCVTEPKFSTDFIFVQYSFYNFLQNKSCFYTMLVIF